MLALDQIARVGWANLTVEVDRSRFAKIIAYSAGTLAGASYIQLDYAQKFHLDSFSISALAITGLLAIAVMLHVLGHVSRDRALVIDAWFKAALCMIGAAVVATFLNEVFMFAGVAAITTITSLAARSNWLRGNGSKLRTVFATTGMVIAEFSFLLALISTAFR